MSLEIKQVLERDFGLDVTTAEIRALTFEKLQQLADSIAKGDKLTKFQKSEITHKILFQTLGDENVADEILTPLNVTDSNRHSDTLALFISGIEGVHSATLSALCNCIEIPIYAVQYHAHCRVETLSELVSKIAQVIDLQTFKFTNTALYSIENNIFLPQHNRV